MKSDINFESIHCVHRNRTRQIGRVILICTRGRSFCDSNFFSFSSSAREDLGPVNKVGSLIPSPCLSPCSAFPSPSGSIHFGDVTEANGRETRSQKQNAHECVAF